MIGRAFPHCFGDRQSEAFLQAFLHDDAGMALQGVDDSGILFDITHRQHHQVNAGALPVVQLAPGAKYLVERRRTFRVIGNRLHRRPDQHEFRLAFRVGGDEVRETVHDPDRDP